jgi:thiamine biosynthesis protein ThiC
MIDICEGVAGVDEFDAFETGSREYLRIHGLVNRIKGPAYGYRCIQCGELANKWAWQHGEDPNLIRSYEAMCNICHFHYDDNGKFTGHLIGNRHTVGMNVNVGIDNAMSKLTEEQVLDIRDMWDTGLYRQKEIAEYFGRGLMTIKDIIYKNTWRHI